MQNKGMLSGALMLSVGGVLAKVFSAVYRIVLTRILGGVGIGLYQLIFPLYSLCVVIATAGIPMAISKVIAKHPDNQASVIKKCLIFTCSISLTLSALLVIFSKLLARLQGEQRLAICYLILAPTIIVVGVCSVLRGIFQGRKQFTPSALSNIAEQFVKLVLGLALSLMLVKVSIFSAIIGAMVAIVVSEVVALLILLFFLRKRKTAKGEDVPFKEIMRDILPITFTNVLLPVAGFVDSLIVVNLLAFNFTKADAIYMYGLESGAVGSLIGLPTIFSFAIASVILPCINRQSKNKQTQLNLAIKIVIILTLPCVLLFLVVPKQLLLILYGGRFMNSNAGGLDIAGLLLQISGVGILFLAINQVLSSSLQAMECRRVTVKNLSIAVLFKFIIELALMPTKMFNIYALSLGNTICYFVVMLLNYISIKKRVRCNITPSIKVLLINIVMAACVLLLNSVVVGKLNFLLALIVVALLYCYSIFKLNVFNKKENAYFKYKIY